MVVHVDMSRLAIVASKAARSTLHRADSLPQDGGASKCSNKVLLPIKQLNKPARNPVVGVGKAGIPTSDPDPPTPETTSQYPPPATIRTIAGEDPHKNEKGKATREE